MNIKLYHYFRSSASYRVRIALNFKELTYQEQTIHLVRNGGEQYSSEYQAINPHSAVPALEIDGQIITQSLAIIEYLEERFPTPHLLPQDLEGRARVRALSELIACDIHPLNNRVVLVYLENEFHISDEQKTNWIAKWIESGFYAFETHLARDKATGQYCHGDTPTMADLCLVPQVFNAIRFNVPLKDYPNILRINENCLKIDQFQRAHPNQYEDK
ncbi:MAG: maleylacetoacetate isomerase [Gammaproteobacteria bacterium]